jgi:DNA invertase Pin-like site-specific DNA recombinase
MGQFKSVIIAIFAEINKVQADLISEKTKLGLARKREQGVILGRPKGAKDKKKRKRTGYIENYHNNPNHPLRNKGVAKNE